ncbi:MAG: deoxyribonuclease V [Dehalococcoidales bacterium]|jgi:deoxyribonuclease V|nr:deoxyribonuclease V [Dehalococcoidales bacterium]
MYNSLVADANIPLGQVSPAGAVALQKELASRVIRSGRCSQARYIAGIDVSFPFGGGEATAAVVVLDYPGLNVVEVSRSRASASFPYIPGLLSFRELPLALKAFDGLKISPDLVIIDGHGVAHPRRMGIACHFGLYVDMPVIGCAKSRLCGTYLEPDTIKGSKSSLVEGGEVIGTVLCTRQDVRPVFVSVGNRIELESAEEWVSGTCSKYRLPEPVRKAHMAAGLPGA